jgi:hypothetical protein
MQGGYEVDGFIRFFSLDGSFVPDFADRVRQDLAELIAPFTDSTDTRAYASHVTLLRKTIDQLLNERDHLRAQMLRDRSASKAAVNLAEARLAGAEARSEQLIAAAAQMREQLRATLDDIGQRNEGRAKMK